MELERFIGLTSEDQLTSTEQEIRKYIDNQYRTARSGPDEAETLVYSNSGPRGRDTFQSDTMKKYFRIQEDGMMEDIEDGSLSSSRLFKLSPEKEKHDIHFQPQLSNRTKKIEIKPSYNVSPSAYSETKKTRNTKSRTNVHGKNLFSRKSSSKQLNGMQKLSNDRQSVRRQFSNQTSAQQSMNHSLLSEFQDSVQQNMPASEQDQDYDLFRHILINNDYFRIKSLEDNFEDFFKKFDLDFIPYFYEVINVVILESEQIRVKESKEASKLLLAAVQLYEIRQYKKSNDQLDKILKFVKRSPPIRLFSKLMRTLNNLRLNKYETGMIKLHKIFIGYQSSNINFKEIFQLFTQNKSSKTSLTNLELENQAKMDQAKDKVSTSIQLYLSVKLCWAITGYILSRLLMSSNNSNIAKHYIQAVVISINEEMGDNEHDIDILSLLYLRAKVTLAKTYSLDTQFHQSLGILRSIKDRSEYFSNLKSYKMAKIYVKMNRLEEAIEVLEDCDLIQNGDIDLQKKICRNLAVLYKYKGMEQKEILILQVLDKLLPSNFMMEKRNICKEQAVLSLKSGNLNF